MSFEQNAAVVAAGLASEAVTELLRYAREGYGLPSHPFGTQDPVVELAQAIVATAEIERDGLAALQGHDWAVEIGMLGQLVNACTKFVRDWTGQR